MVIAPSAMIAIASFAAVSSVAVLRYSWGLPTRRSAINAGAWVLAVLAVIIAWLANGAWGVSIASLWAMAAASVVLAYAAWKAPAPKAAKGRPARSRPARPVLMAVAADGDTIGGAGASSDDPIATQPPSIAKPPRHIGRRLATFGLVAILPIFLCVGVAVMLRAVLAWAGWSEVNAIVAALTLMPLLWMWLCYDLLTKARAAQLRTLAIYALPGLVMLFWGWVR